MYFIKHHCYVSFLVSLFQIFYIQMKISFKTCRHKKQKQEKIKSNGLVF